MKKDSSGVVVGRVFITIFLTISLGLVSLAISLGMTVFNLKTWRDFLTSEECMDALLEESNIDEIMEDPILEDNLDEQFFTDYCVFLFDELFDAMETGDTDIDEERLDDIYDKYLEDIVSDNAPRAERNRLKDDFMDSTCDTIEEAYDSMDESGFIDGLETFRRIFTGIVAGFGVVSAVLIILMICISKIKFAAMRNTGIALVVSEVLNMLLMGGVGAIFVMAAKSSEELGALLAEFFVQCTLKAELFLGAGLALGIFFIVFGAVSMKNEAKVNDIEDQPYMMATEE